MQPTSTVERDELLAGVREVAFNIVQRFDRAYYMDQTESRGGLAELWDAMAEHDLLAAGVPESVGGVGGGIGVGVTIMETMAGEGVPPLGYSGLAFSREALIKHGSPEQREQHLGRMMRGEEHMCFGVTEPDAGTNSFAIRSSARPSGNGAYVLNGQKVFISAADHADCMMFIARDADHSDRTAKRHGFSLFVVDMRTPGIELRPLDIRGFGPEGQYEIYLDDVEVPADALIGERGMGFTYLLDCLNSERLIWAAGMVGLGDYAIRRAVAYAKERAPFGAPIGSYQAVQHPLALAKVHLEAARQLTHKAALDYEEGRPAGEYSTMAKFLASRAALEAVEAAIQTHGGHAFVQETDIVTLWPMVRVMQVAPLNNESVLNYIGERVLGLPRSY